MLALSRYTTKVILALLLATVVKAQSVFFTNYPTQVVSEQFYPVSWDSGGLPVTVNLLKAGALEETLFTAPDGSVTSFIWEVDDDYDGGTGYSLQLVPASGTPISSGMIWIIDDDDGLFVDGQLIFASVSNGPTSSGIAPTTASSSTTTSLASSGSTAERTQTMIFTSAETSYVFVTAITPSAEPSAPPKTETLTFVSNGLSFTTTITVDAATSTPSSVGPGTNAGSKDGGGISGGAIAGIVIGVVAFLLLVIGLLWLHRRRKYGGCRSLGNPKSTSTTEKYSEEQEKTAQRTSLVSSMSLEPHEMESALSAPRGGKDTMSCELDSMRRHEMNAAPPTYELAAEDVAVDRNSKMKYPVTSTSVSGSGAASNNGRPPTGSISASSNL